MACLNNIASFRCKKCGHLEDSGHAGENMLPHACSVCGSGMVHGNGMEEISQKLADPNCTTEQRIALAAELSKLAKNPGGKVLDPDNWETLWNATDERLKALGLTRKDVCEHKPAKVTAPSFGRHVAVSGGETVGVQDKA